MGHAAGSRGLAVSRALGAPTAAFFLLALAALSLYLVLAVRAGQDDSKRHTVLAVLDLAGGSLRLSRATLIQASGAAASALHLSVSLFGLSATLAPLLLLFVVVCLLLLVEVSARRAPALPLVDTAVQTTSPRRPSPKPAPPWKVIGDALVAKVPQQPPGTPLCSGLVVRQPAGITLAMKGPIERFQQTDVLTVVQVSTGELVARAIFAEEAGGTIILETSLKFPVAFLHTDNALGLHGDAPPGPKFERRVDVHRANSVILPPADGDPPFCTVRRDGAGDGFVVLLVDGVGKRASKMLRVRISPEGNAANVLNTSTGQLLGAMESVVQEGPQQRPNRLLHIAVGVDASIILVAVIASLKLR